MGKFIEVDDVFGEHHYKRTCFRRLSLPTGKEGAQISWPQHFSYD